MIHDMQNEAVLKGLKRKAEKITLDVAPGKMVKKNKHCRASKAKWTADEVGILSFVLLLSLFPLFFFPPLSTPLVHHLILHHRTRSLPEQ